MWPEVKQAKYENRHELILTGEEINKKLIENDGELDPAIFKLQQLNFLRISNTPLVKLPLELRYLNNLNNLVLVGNELKELPSCIGELDKLKLLDFSQNVIETIPDEIGQLKNLATLIARNNKLTKICSFVNCVQLAHLDLRNNLIDSFPDVCDENLNVLAEVRLSGNSITDIPPEIFYLVSLKLLDLENNCIEIIPGELTDIDKLKELNLKGNPLTDRRLRKLVENDRTLPRQVLLYAKQHCPRALAAEGGKSGGKGKKGKGSKTGKSKSEDEVDVMCDQIEVMTVTETLPVVRVFDVMREVRPYIVCCVLRNLNLSGTNLQIFLSAQTKLHEGVCEKRLAATIATHDLSRVNGQLDYCAKPPQEIRIQPLLHNKVFSARHLLQKLQTEADVQRKQQKRNSVSGIHKYLHLLDGRPLWPCLVNEDGMVLSLHPITNAEKTKITTETTDIFVEVTSSASLNKAKEVLDELVLAVLQLGITSQRTEGGRNLATVQQIKVTNEDGGLKVIYPSHTDLANHGERVQVIRLTKE